MSEISCRISSTFISYVKNTRPEFLQPLLDGLGYDEKYLSDPDNWIPWETEQLLEERLTHLFNDERIMFKIGRSVLTLKSMGIVNTLFSLFMTPERLIRATPKLARYFTKDIVYINVIETTKESATVEIRIKGKQTRGACLYNQGLYTTTTEFFGLEAADLTEVQCVVPLNELGSLNNKTNGTIFGAESCIYKLQWKNKIGFINKFARKKMTMKDALQHLEENHAKLQKAYESIRKSEENYRDLMENASDIICFLDSDGVVTSLNKKGVELSGYTSEEVIGGNFISLVDDQYQKEFLLRFRESLNGSTTVFELVIKKKDGSHLLLSINSNPIREDGNIIGIMFIARDITEEREIARRLLEAERFAAKGMVAAEIAHEINNSLANIETGLFIIKNIRIDSPYRRDLLDDIYEEIERMSGIVKGILEVYRSGDSGIQSVDINREIEKVIKMVQRRLKGKGIAILSKLSHDLPSVPCCPGHIKQLLLNLIKNAEEAMDSSISRLIVIRTEGKGDSINIIVSDTGCGIPKRRIGTIFSSSFTSKTEGTGLGLSICHEIVKGYNGEIAIESEEGKGTTVIVSLPCGGTNG